MKKLFITLVLLFLPVFFYPPVARAQMFQDWNTYKGGCVDKVTDSTGKTAEVATLRCLPIVFHNVVSGFLLFVGAVALFMIIYSGIKLILSGGDQKQLEAARKIMTSAIIGVILVLSSFAILYFVGFLTKSTDCVTNVDNIATGGCK